ncbi:hypothetical protein MLD38_003225 [Melastoma candidum]|uniref:Uncharacterized protein n=1 Tax=Melastoma candidum TaxID=119954 RepID=A0ACB9S1D6_9MYRT|nr:hypothetical protein MLD38_003225 [Melastoma candidum]
MAFVNSRCALKDIPSLLSSGDRDFLIRRNGNQVQIQDLAGKIICLYFSDSLDGPCSRFTPVLCEVYEALSPGGDFEVIIVPSDKTEESFNKFLSTVPWLTIPSSDETTVKRLKDMFGVKTIPHITILDQMGNVLTRQGLSLIRDYGADAYPFTAERIDSLTQEEEVAKENQSLIPMLVSKSRDYLVPVSELVGKTIGLYFSVHGHRVSQEFTLKLIDYHARLQETVDDFEIVLVPLDNQEEDFRQGFKTIPWPAVPFGDKTCKRLSNYFEIRTLPTLTIIGRDGKTLNQNVAELIEEHGIEAYPFTTGKLLELGAVTKARMAAETLESVLTLSEHDFVINRTGSKIPISQLAGKNILLYFSAHWCPPCRAFLPKLTEAYNDIKNKDDTFEIIFISRDHDQASFDDYFSTMPWLAFPFGDPRHPFLLKKYRISGIPSAVVINPNGQTVTKEARALLTIYGAAAYPFTEDHLKPLDEELEGKAKSWPEKLRHEIHGQHELVRTRRYAFMCGECREAGFRWSFRCKPCNFDLHPSCCLKMDEEASENGGTRNDPKQGWTCEGDTCRKAPSSS